jgi:hypothetical protein
MAEHEFHGDITTDGKVSAADAVTSTQLTSLQQVQALIAAILLPAFKSPAATLKTAAALPAHGRVGNVLTASGNGALTVDGVAVDTTMSVLVDQEGGGTHLENGLYSVTAAGSGGTPWVLTRRTDADTSAEVVPGMIVAVEKGSTWADSAWILTTDGPITLNTTALTFGPFVISTLLAGAGLAKSGVTLSIGADWGVIVSADSVGVDKSVVMTRKTGLVGGAGPATSYTIPNPGFSIAGTDEDLITCVIKRVSDGQQVYPVVTPQTNGDILVDFGGSSVAGTAYRYVADGKAS